MDEGLLAAFRATLYRVRLSSGKRADIRIDQPLPATLRPLVGDSAWGFITAWNPRAQLRPRSENRQAQHQLLLALQRHPTCRLVRAGVGMASDGRWQEPSLFVVGPETDVLDRLALTFCQHGYVHGLGDGVARLRLPPPTAGVQSRRLPSAPN